MLSTNLETNNTLIVMAFPYMEMITAMIVDDDMDAVDSVSEILSLEGIQVVAKCYNGKEGFELYKKHKPDFVILDMKMPEYDGIYAMTNIKKYDPFAKIVVVTGYTDYNFDKKEVEAVLTKPYDVEKLLKLVKKLPA